MKADADTQVKSFSWRRGVQALALAGLLLTVVAPPLNHVRSDMQEMLYGYAREVQVVEQSFAGHRLLAAGSQARDIGRNVPGNFYSFQREEYRIAWLVLLAEWIVLGSVAIAAHPFERVGKSGAAAHKPAEPELVGR
jgi:hypothetical protein